MLVSSLQQFSDYQRERAWIWEHQALVRARPIAGHAKLRQQFQNLRTQILCKQREPGVLLAEVRAMRQRLSAVKTQISEKAFDLKSGQGGVVTIEFIVQCLILRWAYQYPKLGEWTDNMRNLELFGELGLLSAHAANFLQTAYKAYRSRVHRCDLQNQPALVSLDTFTEMRQQVESIWQKVLESG
jgi:glutamate-ammonia-ligase adenylyltransferase